MQIDFDLPSVVLPEVSNPAAMQAKYAEELAEWRREPDKSFAKVVELWDVLQVVATMLANGGGSQAIECHFNARRLMAQYPVDTAISAKQTMLIKNAARTREDGGTGYYSPPVCQRIIETGGAEWKPENAEVEVAGGVRG